MKIKFIALAFIMNACKPPTPAQEVTGLKVELAIVQTKCAVYTLDPKYPRDEVVTEKCDRLVKP